MTYDTGDRYIDENALWELMAQESTQHPEFTDDPRFMSWLVARERVRIERRSRVSPAQHDCIARGAILMARAQARRLSVRHEIHAPDLVPAARIGTVSHVVELASRMRMTPLVQLSVAAGAGRELWDEPVDEWIVLPDHVHDGQHVALRIAGESMAPLMHTGDTVLIKLNTPPTVNSVIVARREEEGYVCKRVARLLPDRIELASLEAGHPPFTIPRDSARARHRGDDLACWRGSLSA